MRFFLSSSHRAIASAASAAIVGVVLASGSALHAQSSATSSATHDDRWQPWLGCWKPAGELTPMVSAGESVTLPTLICVVPGQTSTSVDIVNFSGGTITERTTIEPGQVVTKKVDDCSGTETSTWSADGRRVLLRGKFTCGRGVVRNESGIMSIDFDGEWVQAQTVNVNGNAKTFVARFRDTGIALEGIANGAIVERPMLDAAGKRLSPSREGCTGSDTVVPSADGARVSVTSSYTCAGGLRRVANAEFTRAEGGQWMRVGGSVVPFGSPSVRSAAGAAVNTDDVLEVAKVVDPTVAEAWLSDRGQAFALDGKELVRLSKNGMPPRVIDMMVAMSNPKTFVMRRNDGAAATVGLAPQEDQRADINRSMRGGDCISAMDYCSGMMGMGWMYGADRYYGFGPWGYQYGYPFGSRFGNGFGNGWGFGNYWGPGYYNGNGPVVVVVPSDQVQQRGRAVYGQGYTRGAGGSSSTPRGSASDYPRSGGSMGGGSMGGSSGGGGSTGGASSGGGSSSGGSSGGEVRTAKPRGGGE